MYKNKFYNSNKGFSLVEIIIVIAIMAILSAALAPQLMKYIEKSRVSTDKQTCSAIESIINVTLATDDATHTVDASGKVNTDSIWDRVAQRGDLCYFYICRQGTDGPVLISGLWDGHPTADAIREAVSTIQNPKQTGMNSYEIKIDCKKTPEKPGSKEYVYTIECVAVKTSTYKFDKNISSTFNKPQK